ncbi:DUF938 domain-containing protein [Aurantiacibacter sp. MUD11]|uniref:DUF938 domain-containing protein n=1 Tax=Aurantiacibacter sp. MUD11 TaxID=3003265 RepID=UPI0022AB4160|nr:DUF938 domain-containing protein [Aurantiacibacter sp. MUD11]WAT18769.1 DUF938 domain-containing protein [Aurantiacibacter sp. MUD11]
MSKQYAPATQRNREAIGDVLEREFPESGLVLEIASGTGEHAIYLTRRFPRLTWQPTDPSPEALESIAAWRDEEGGDNLLAPLQLDASAGEWPVERADAIFCSNMTHISPTAATEGLMAAAGRLLAAGAPLAIYGPFLEADVETTASNLDFDASLKSRDPAWGLRDAAWVDGLAAANGLERTARHAMPANNLTLVYRKT